MISPEEMAEMWKESESLRKQLRDEVVYLRGKMDKANQEIELLEQRVSKLEKQNGKKST